MTSLTAIAAPTTTATASSTWKIDPASRVQDKTHDDLVCKGRVFRNHRNIKARRNRLQPLHCGSLDSVASIRTADDKLDAHLKNADFFDVDKFPALTFKSTNIRPTGEADYAVSGDLTTHGVTKSVTLIVDSVSKPSADPWGNQRIGLSGSTKINRKDFGIVWNTALDSGGVLVGDEVMITLDVQFIRG